MSRVVAAARLADEGVEAPIQAALKDDFWEYIRPEFEANFSRNLGPAITRRIDSFIPFFSFNDTEQFILAEMAFSTAVANLKTPVPDYPIGEYSCCCCCCCCCCCSGSGDGGSKG